MATMDAKAAKYAGDAMAQSPSSERASQTHEALLMPKAPSRVSIWFHHWILPIILPIALLIAWDLAVRISGTMLVPSPKGVALMLWDFMFGGIYDDAFSQTLGMQWIKSVERVYLGFGLAAIIGIPLGLIIGKNTTARRFIDPTLQMLRPVPVTAWLPLSMIFFGVGPHAAIFLVFLGAIFPFVLNTPFGGRSVDRRLFEAGPLLGWSRPRSFRH